MKILYFFLMVLSTQTLAQPVWPLWVSTWDRSEKLVNLTSATANNGEFDLELDDFRRGMRLDQYRSYQLGLGVAPQIRLADIIMGAGPYVSIGLEPIKGRTIHFERYIDDASNIPSIPIPYKVKTLQKYRPGDSVAIDTKGGILLQGSIGITGVSLGGLVMAQGGWNMLIRKTSDYGAMVQILKTNVKTATLFADASIITFSASQSRELSEGFTFAFDFSISKNAELAYDRLMSGDVRLAQQLSQIPFSGVAKLKTHRESELIKSRLRTFKIPFLVTRSSNRGRVFGKAETIHHVDQTTTVVKYGVFVKEKHLLTRKKRRSFVKNFYSGESVTTHPDGSIVNSSSTSVMKWSLSDAHMNGFKFSEAMSDLKREFQLGAEFSPRLQTSENIGHIQINASIDLTKILSQKNISQNLFKLVHFYKGSSEDTLYLARVWQNFDLNPQSFQDFVKLDLNCETYIEITIEGRRINRVTAQIPTNPVCR